MSAPFSFARKISLHSVALILISCLSVTAVTAYQFRQELYYQKFRQAFTVYAVASSYLGDHYRAQGDRFDPAGLRDLFRNRFMAPGEAGEDVDAFRPRRLAIYDPEGRRVFDFVPPGEPASPDRRPAERLVRTYTHAYDRWAGTIQGSGPIVSGGETIGYMQITFDTELGRKVRALFLKCAAAMGVVLLMAIVLSLDFARRALAPITALTSAAQRVRAGDLNQRVPVSTADEIGLLASTFNDMVSSLTRRMALMHKMQEWTFRIGKEFDLQKLYETVMEMFERMGQATACRIYVADPKSDGLRLIGYRGGGATISLRGDPLTRDAFERNRALFLRGGRDVQESPAGAVEMALPMFTGNKRMGAVRLGPREDGQPYNEDTVMTLLTLSQLAAVAIDNTRLYKEIAEQARIAQEMEWAREIQRSLLPRDVPRVPGYDAYGVSIPALEVGGDYFDYVRGDNSHLHFVVGDVSGKGVPAALIMSIVRSLIHTCVEMAPSPRDMLAKVNRNLSPDLESEMFVTVADVTVDPLTHTARAVRAGHEPILVVRENGAIERIQPKGTALGLLDTDAFDHALEESKFQIGPRDAVVLFTDGLTETVSREGVEVGYDGVEALVRKYAHLSAKDMVQAIVQEIKTFAGGQDQQDDFTLVVLRRSPATA
jgi:serine phosphatase RsbU (regulator of sigma subunit)/HAMP domain-containing protein